MCISSRTHLTLKHICIVITNIRFLIKSLKRWFDTNLLFLDLFISHLCILLSLGLCYWWLGCLRWYQSTVLKHDVLHWRILTGIWELYFVLIIQIYSFSHFLHLVARFLLSQFIEISNVVSWSCWNRMMSSNLSLHWNRNMINCFLFMIIFQITQRLLHQSLLLYKQIVMCS